MDIRLKKAIAETIGLKKFVPFGINEDSWRYRGSRGASVEIALQRLSKPKLADLEKIFEPHAKVRGVGVILRDIALYKESILSVKGAKPRTVKQFESILIKFLAAVPGHRLYSRYGAELDSEDPDETDATISEQAIDTAAETWLAYYVNRVEYEPAVEHGDRRHPAYVVMHLQYTQYGGRRSTATLFYEQDCRGMNVVSALAQKGWYAESPTLRAGYRRSLDRYMEVVPRIGHQFLAIGTGIDDPDGNREGRSSSWYWKQSNNIDMVRNGEPTRCVVDVFYEEGNKSRERVDSVNKWFWTNATKGHPDPDESVDEDADEISIEEMAEDDDTTEEIPVIEIPVHPWVVVFDFAKHLRLRVHVDQLTDYQYDPHLADKLILSAERKSLIKLLIESKQSAFKDIVKGKAGGSVVLLTGPPGVGKTLTAEVYAESENRALYSIQCSQLGTNPDNIEEELLKVFARARRWNAVMLIDEADVYVHERGNDLQQNAIVGVFLRVLEYQSSVLFLTTNRPDDVDDAIASRCIARLDYQIPTDEEQAQIWRVLLEGCGAKMNEATIRMVVEANPGLSGRDIKNLLKLARVMQPGSLGPGTIEFVKQFKPTGAREI